jgi:hypothetical protein
VRDILVYKAQPETASLTDLPDSGGLGVGKVSTYALLATQQQNSEAKSLQLAAQQQRALRGVVEKLHAEKKEMQESLQTTIGRLRGLIEIVFPYSQEDANDVRSKLPKAVTERLVTVYRKEILGTCDTICEIVASDSSEAALISCERDGLKNSILGVLGDWEKRRVLVAPPKRLPT